MRLQGIRGIYKREQLKNRAMWPMRLAERLRSAVSRKQPEVQSDRQAPDAPADETGFLPKTGSFPRLLSWGMTWLRLCFRGKLMAGKAAVCGASVSLVCTDGEEGTGYGSQERGSHACGGTVC